MIIKLPFFMWTLWLPSKLQNKFIFKTVTIFNKNITIVPSLNRYYTGIIHSDGSFFLSIEKKLIVFEDLELILCLELI
jgi:hypothetical protein